MKGVTSVRLKSRSRTDHLLLSRALKNMGDIFPVGGGTPERCPEIPGLVTRAAAARLKSRRVETAFGRRHSHRPERQDRSGGQYPHLSVPQ